MARKVTDNGKYCRSAGKEHKILTIKNYKKMLKTQFGESATADLEEGTWTFEIRDELKVSAGVFAIIPEQKYQKLLIDLRGIRNSMNAHPDCEPNSELSDMVSRCDKILEELAD